MVSFLILLSGIAVIVNGEISPQETTNVFPGDIRRFPLRTNQTYKFSVQFSETEEKQLEGFIFQGHSQRHTMTLSTSQEPVYGSYVKGTNVGLWKSLSSGQTTFYYYVYVASYEDFTESENVTVMIAVPTISVYAAIPGGCTLTSPLETDPNIRLNYTSYSTSVVYEDGNVGYNPHTSEFPNDCSEKSGDVSEYQMVHYTVYHKVLSIGDYSEDHMFDAIEDMLTASTISDNKDGIPHFSMDSTGIKSAAIDSYEGDGVVYNVVAEVSGRPSTAYVPAVTYSCDFSIGSSGCKKYIDTVHIVVGVVLALVGLFLLYGAHRLFHIEVYIFHSLIFMFLCYIVVGHVPLHAIGSLVLEMRLSIALACALVLGGVMFLVWFFSGWYLPSVLLFTSTAGFLLISTLMFALSFTSVDSISFMKVSYVYLLLFACVIVLVLIPAVIFPRAMNILSSSAIGSYLLIFSFGMFSYSSLMEILLRVVKNATLSGYMKTEANYSFGIKDLILTFIWAVLLITGVAVQSLFAYKRKPHFPEPSLYKKCLRKFKKKSDTINENTKLLNSYSNS